jgi:Ca2+-binding RTX toxin-like protein
MATVTVLGANNQTVTLSYSSNDAALAAQALANTIVTDLQSGQLTPIAFTGATLPTESNAALFVSTGGVLLAQPSGYNVLVDNAAGPISVVGNAGAQERVQAGSGGLFYYFGAASSGTVVAGDGNNYITTADPGTGAIPTSGGVYNVIVGAGSNTIALETGQSTVSTGLGMNAVALGTSTSVVNAAGGETTVFGDVAQGAAPGSGSDTVNAGAGYVSVYGGHSNFTFMGGTGTVTVQGVGGSDTVFANGSTGLFASGTAGNSLIQGGNASATAVSTFTDSNGLHVTSGQLLVGIANGDQLVAAASGAEALHAGAGNETLNGSSSTANNSYYTGSNAAVNGGTFYAVTQVSTGAGTSTVFGGTGFSTVTGGSGSNTYEFVQGQAGGGTMTVTNFDPSKDQVRLYGYASGTAQAAVAGAQVGSGGTVVTLSDNTRITFQGYTGGFNSHTFA